MKHVATLIFGLAAMLILASCFIGGEEKEPVTKTTIMEELKEEGWTEIYVEPTGEDDNSFIFYVEQEIEGKPIMVEGSLVYDKWIEPVEMTAYGYQNGCYYEIGSWDVLNDDWAYTDFGTEFMYDVRH